MKTLNAVIGSIMFLLFGLGLSTACAQTPKERFTPVVPKTYQDAETVSWHLPLARAEFSPTFLPSDYFYARKVRPIYRTYPVYHPDREPAGYQEELKTIEPEVLWDAAGKRPSLETESDWILAGELVYDAPIGTRPAWEAVLRDPAVLKRLEMPVATDGSLPGVYYVIRVKGKPELSLMSCATCHTRVIPSGMIIKGTQGNLPIARLEALDVRAGKPDMEAELRQGMFEYHGTPWLETGPNTKLLEWKLEQFAQASEACPPGVYPNHNGGLLTPARAAEIRGIKERRYMDGTGHMRHRGPSDLMRFSDFHQWASIYARFGTFRPQSIPEANTQQRYSDEQVYALSLYLYSLTVPPNLNPPQTETEKARIARGRDIFMDSDNRCATCHDPKQGFTNNKLTPVDGYKVPANHPEKAHIMLGSIGTDPTFALLTRKGTGFYKVPTLLGLWYRGPFEHNGSVATLEDWFDKRRLRDDYVPTGWKGPPGTKTRAVKGHDFGLDLSPDEKSALIAFLRTL